MLTVSLPVYASHRSDKLCGSRGVVARFHDSAAQKAIAAKTRPNARILLSARREFILARDGLVTVKAILERAYCRARPKRFKSWHYHSARRALRRIGAVVVARQRFGRGRAALWRLKQGLFNGAS